MSLITKYSQILDEVNVAKSVLSDKTKKLKELHSKLVKNLLLLPSELYNEKGSFVVYKDITRTKFDIIEIGKISDFPYRIIYRYDKYGNLIKDEVNKEITFISMKGQDDDYSFKVIRLSEDICIVRDNYLGDRSDFIDNVIFTKINEFTEISLTLNEVSNVNGEVFNKVKRKFLVNDEQLLFLEQDNDDEEDKRPMKPVNSDMTDLDLKK